MSDELPNILCQPDGTKSCGACCGMYNHTDHGEDEIRGRLLERTLAFHQAVDIEDTATLRRFRRRWEDGEDVKLLEALPSCPFLGYIDVEPGDDDPEPGKVGCMVHPTQNDGVDGRDCGVYDRFICDEYLCAAHDVLRRREVQLVLDAVDDSYLYGLLITNPRFVRKLLELVARRIGTAPKTKHLAGEEVVEAAAGCFEMMRDWPYRGDDGIYGQVRVDAELNMTRRAMPAERHGVDAEPVDALLVCLGTECDGVDELQQARREANRLVDRLAAAVAAQLP